MSIEGWLPPAHADLDGDGWEDLVVPQEDGGASLVMHDDLVLGGSSREEDASASFEAPYWMAHVGGDLDGDGSPDLLFGSSKDGPKVRGGAVWVAWGADLDSWLAGGDTLLPLEIDGTRMDDAVGWPYGAAGVGDLDADGASELLVAANAGAFDALDGDGLWRACLFRGSELPEAGVLEVDACALGFEKTGTSVDHRIQVFGPVDFDGDGLGDIVVKDYETHIWFGWPL